MNKPELPSMVSTQAEIEAVSGDASEWHLHDYESPTYLDGCQAQWTITKGKPYPFGDTVAYVFDEADAKRIMDALAAPASAQAGEQSDEELGRITYEGYNDYWTEDCDGKDSNAWIACGKAVLASQASLAKRGTEPSLADLGWQQIECPVCGDLARAAPPVLAESAPSEKLAGAEQFRKAFGLMSMEQTWTRQHSLNYPEKSAEIINAAVAAFASQGEAP